MNFKRSTVINFNSSMISNTPIDKLKMKQYLLIGTYKLTAETTAVLKIK